MWPKIARNWDLLIVDLRLTVYLMSSTTAESTIGKLRNTFSGFGLPEEIEFDDGPLFNGTEY